jgi:ABC-type transport system substrate-binding protein
MKGGGDAVSAARAVIQTGEYDHAWNMQVEDEILVRLEAGGSARGRAEIFPSGNIEHIEINNTDPWTDVEGERSSAKTKHPLFSDPAVRQALALLVDRDSRRNSSRRTRIGSSTSRRPTSYWSRRAGSADRTASAPGTASSSS